MLTRAVQLDKDKSFIIIRMRSNYLIDLLCAYRGSDDEFGGRKAVHLVDRPPSGPSELPRSPTNLTWSKPVCNWLWVRIEWILAGGAGRSTETCRDGF